MGRYEQQVMAFHIAKLGAVSRYKTHARGGDRGQVLGPNVPPPPVLQHKPSGLRICYAG